MIASYVRLRRRHLLGDNPKNRAGRNVCLMRSAVATVTSGRLSTPDAKVGQLAGMIYWRSSRPLFISIRRVLP